MIVSTSVIVSNLHEIDTRLNEPFLLTSSYILGGCPFNGPLSGMKYPTRTKSTTRHDAFRSDVNIAFVAIRNSFWFNIVFFYRVSSYQIRSLTQSVGAMLWSMAQLRRCQLLMGVCVLDSCWWCGQLSVLARHTHMPHCPPVPTSSWMLCTDRPQFAVGLESSIVFGSGLLPWRPLLGPTHSGVLGWVRMLPTPASTLPQSTHPSIGPQGWHLASPEPPCYRVSFIVVSCRMCQSCFTAFCAKARVAAFRLMPAGAIPTKTGSWNTGLGLRQPAMVRRELLIATSKLSCLY